VNVNRLLSASALALLCATIVACSGGGGGSSGGGGGGFVPTPTPAATATPATSNSATYAITTSGEAVALPPAGGYTGTITVPPVNQSASLTIADNLSVQGGNPVLQGVLKRAAAAWNPSLKQPQSATNTPMLYFSFTSNLTVTGSATPGFSVTVPVIGTGPYYIAAFIGGQWQTVLGPGTISGSTITFAAGSGAFQLAANTPLYLALYTGGVIATPTPAATSTPSATPTVQPTVQPASACTFNNTNPQSVGAQSEGLVRRYVASGSSGPRYVPGVIEVVGTRGAAMTAAIRQSRVGVIDNATDMPASGTALRVIRVAPGTEDAAIAALRAMPGVQDVTRAKYRSLATAGVYAPNDKYWSSNGTGSPPFYQTDAAGGQWDMHLICVSRAWGYSQPLASGNTFGVTPGVLAGSVKLAIIDTGVDTTHPDLAGKVVYSQTIVNGVQTAGVHDNNGHGTNVTGIAGADTNNGFGFVGAGFNVQIMAYRVFPDPTPGCTGTACETTASTSDIDAINDAVAHGANVINLSLGGVPTGTCATDPSEASERAVIANATAAGVVIVAAAGNDGTGTLECPGGDPGVIAAGASSLTDNGVGTAVTGEHIASYSNYDSSNPTGWGVSAPGGDPTGSSDGDFYHWIENIWTSTDADTADGNACTQDVFGETGNCRILIAGTSQATPHIAGVVALMLGAKPTLSPATIKADLCSTAVSIGDAKQGCGRIDAYRAVAKALGDGTVP
jgi:subtilisin family serine protease